MSKESKQSNKKKNTTTKKKVEEKVTIEKNTKASKNKNKEKEVKQNKIRVLDSNDEEIVEEYNEDLEEDFEDDEIEEIVEDFQEETDEELEEIIEEEVIEVKPIPKKEKKKEKNKEVKPSKTSKEKIEKIEKIAKEKNKKVKTKNNKLSNTFLAIDKNRHLLYGFIAGLVLTILVAIIIWPDRIATLKDGTQPIVKVGKNTYTADELYENMKDYYSVSLLLDDIDNDLLTKLYPEDDEMNEEVKSNAEYYFNMYEQYYGYTEEQFLKQNGFSSYDAFIDYLKLDYRRNKYLDEYIEKNLSDDEIQKYYDKNVFGDINTQHVLVEVTSTEDDGKLSDEDAKKLAEEIITKLNDGTSWETIQKDYKDKITYEDLSYQSWDASLEETFMTALRDMENNTYSTEPIKTSYGYHVIYRIDQKEKPSLKETKEKIIENLIADKKAEDGNLLYKSLISLREEKNIDFKDTVMKSKYKDYCEQYK